MWGTASGQRRRTRRDASRHLTAGTGPSGQFATPRRRLEAASIAVPPRPHDPDSRSSHDHEDTAEEPRNHGNLDSPHSSSNLYNMSPLRSANKSGRLEPILKLMLPAETRSGRRRIEAARDSESRAAPSEQASRENGCAKSWYAPPPSGAPCHLPCRPAAARHAVGCADGFRAVGSLARRAGSRTPYRGTSAEDVAAHVGHA
jgi:hypothetical protein